MQVKQKSKTESIVNKYTDDVLKGRIPTCRYVKLAIQRHLNDMENAAEKGLYFDQDAAERVIEFFGLLKHSKGIWAGKPFVLEPWQQWILWVVFGWKRIADDSRRFNTVYEEIARKNGKSTQLAALGLYGLCFDNESGAEVYSVATKEDQARITFSEAQKMAMKSSRLGGLVAIHKKSISMDSTYSSWRPLGRDSKTQDGLNPHMVLVDEFHAHPDRSMLGVMDSALGARMQPLIYIITTAGYNPHCCCFDERNYAISVLNGTIEDDTYFAIIYTLDRDEQTGEVIDDWHDPKNWIKSNPNLGVSVFQKDLERMYKKAVDSAATTNTFLTKKMNIWTTQEVKWINIDKWNANKMKVGENELVGKLCYGALDLSSNTDIACWGMVFPWDNNSYVYLPRFFIPKDNAREREKVDKVPYLKWAQEGYISLTKGNCIDYDVIVKQVFDDCQKFKMHKIAFDRWNFEAIRQRLVKEGIPENKMYAFGQGYASMSAPMKKVEKVYLAQELIHNGNPVLSWMAENTCASTDPADNIKPDKQKSAERIDGIVCLIMGLGLDIVEPHAESVYEQRGMIQL